MNTCARIALSSLAAVLALTACHPGGGAAPTTTRAEVEANLAPRQVDLVRPEVRDERREVTLVGEVRAFDTVVVAAEVAGRVERVRVEVGDRVAAGAPLVEIDATSFSLRRDQAAADLAAGRAELTLAERELERKQDLLSDRTIPQSAFDQAQAAFDLARARVAAAEATLALAERDLEHAVVRAPGDGAIVSRHAVAGQWNDVGVGLVELALGGRVKVAAHVPSHWVPYLQGLEGFDFTVRPGEPPRHAKLFSVAPVVREASRSFEIVGTAPADGLKPGLFATIRLTSPETVRSLWLPMSAVVASDTPRLLIAVDGAVEVLRVQTGRRDDGMVEVVSGLDEGEAVIRDVAGLSRGLPVTIVGQE